jgi:hypothetical protein
MTKYLIVSLLALMSTQVSANDFSFDEPILPKPVIALTLDYIPATSDMYGITIAPSHYDTNYANWGYYIGYARSKETDVIVEEPGEAHTKDTQWRFGLSYTLLPKLSLYGGAAAYSSEYTYTNNIVPLIVGGKPVWETDKDTTWGAEIGLRYVVGKHLSLGAGYNSATESAVFSIGYSM